MTCGEADMWKENELAKTYNGETPPSSETGHSDESVETQLPNRQHEHQNASNGFGTLRPRSVSTSTHASHDSTLTVNAQSPGMQSRKTGFELCPSCIEVHGLEHSRAASMASRHRMTPGEWARRGGELRHTFREKVWGSQGWQDVGASRLNYTRSTCLPG